MTGNEDELRHVRLAFLVDPGTGASVEAKREHLVRAIREAPNADLLVLPYLAAQPPFWNRIDRAAAFRYAERPPAPTLTAVHEAAQERRLPLLASTYEALGEGVFYALGEIRGADGTLMCQYRQWHALNLPGLHERLYFQPGSGAEPPVFGIGSLGIGLMMGSDLWVPEMARLLRMAGVRILLAVTALPDQHLDQGKTLAMARSIENGLPVILANRGQAPVLFSDGAQHEPEQTRSSWSMISLDLAAIQKRLRSDDPLWMRRTRLYVALARRWENQP